ncbi:MAG: hypothetical protein HY231_25650 [Acidobacteria bacterium]|nr:hypothetical protein [Acidobacteriota bacterium]
MMGKNKFFNQFLRWQQRSLMMLLVSLMLFPFGSANAQSGRKIPKTPTKPPETTTPKEPPPSHNASPSPTKAPQLAVLVTFQLQTFNSEIYSRYVAQGCLERLHRALAVKGQSGREMNRKEAADFAKASAEVYVLWFELESDAFNSASASRNDISSMYVNYVLYAPNTGKLLSSGHVYQNQRGGLTRQLPQNLMTAEYLLRRTGSELADRVFKVLNLPLPPERF